MARPVSTIPGRLSFLIASLASILAAACSDGQVASDSGIPMSTDSGHQTITPVPDAGYPATSSTTHDTGAAATDASMPRTDAGAPDAPRSDAFVAPVTNGDAGSIVINEVCGKSTDFVELFNAGATSIDLTGWGVTEAKEGDGGLGSPKSPAVFASGSTLATGQYAVVYGAPKDGGAPLGACPATVCLQATWNVSNSNGASVYLLAPSSAQVASTLYPAETVGSGQSWGRLPNGTGSFSLNTATPGTANAGP
jgi:hypothetical protein